MQRIRHLMNRVAPAWVLMWFVVSANLFAVCCVDEAGAVVDAEAHADHGHDIAHDHGAGDTGTGHVCALTLAEPDSPQAPPPAEPRFFDDGAVAAVPHLPELRPADRAFVRRHPALHGPPPDGRTTYLHTRRLRI